MSNLNDFLHRRKKDGKNIITDITKTPRMNADTQQRHTEHTTYADLNLQQTERLVTDNKSITYCNYGRTQKWCKGRHFLPQKKAKLHMYAIL